MDVLQICDVREFNQNDWAVYMGCDAWDDSDPLIVTGEKWEAIADRNGLSVTYDGPLTLEWNRELTAAMADHLLSLLPSATKRFTSVTWTRQLLKTLKCGRVDMIWIWGTTSSGDRQCNTDTRAALTTRSKT